MNLKQIKIAVVGLGYVGLPLAIEFGKHFKTLGFDIKSSRIQDLKKKIDRTREISAGEISASRFIEFSDDPDSLADINVYIVAVPTPIDQHKKPDMAALISASRIVGKYLRPGNYVIYESTVYPGTTEEICIPLLEQVSTLKLNRDFHVGYSPERINPGDKQHTLSSVIKVTSGSTPEAADFVDQLYAHIATAGTHKAASIKIAEAAKIIENTQRDLNIALINELAIIFKRLDIDTESVLKAAGTKWNFLPFRPGLVGGHCIGVDPYYLTYKAQEVGYHPEVILAGRRINDNMGVHVAETVLNLMMQRKIHITGARILVMGLTFKENCPDIRNTRVIDVVQELEQHQAKVDIYDPCAEPEETEAEYGRQLITAPAEKTYDAIILAVAHDEFKKMGAARIRALGKPNCVIFDVKYILPAESTDARL